MLQENFSQFFLPDDTNSQSNLECLHMVLHRGLMLEVPRLADDLECCQETFKPVDWDDAFTD